MLHSRQARQPRCSPIERGADFLEGVHDAVHRSEETDERSRASRGRQERSAGSRACSISVFDARTSERATLSMILNLTRLALRLRLRFELVVELVVARQEETDERARPKLMAHCMNFGELLAPAKNLEERLGVRLCPPKGRPLAENDSPRDEGESQQDDEDGDGNRAGLRDELEWIQRRRVVNGRRTDLLQVLGFYLGAEIALYTRCC